MYDRAEIQRYIAHRDPFLFLDRVVDLDPGRSARGMLQLSGEEPFFAGHFPGRPLMPGVLILEHMAQTANVLVAGGASRGDGEDTASQLVFAGVERARFMRPVVPGDELVTDVTAVKLFETMGLVAAESRVRGEPVARARLQFGSLPDHQRGWDP